jgi:hypothetical protein
MISTGSFLIAWSIGVFLYFALLYNTSRTRDGRGNNGY